jgi:hypothetical protein
MLSSASDPKKKLREHSEHQPQRRWDEVGGFHSAIRSERSEQSNTGSRFHSAIRARDVRAADLQEEPTKRLENRAASPT